MPTPKPAEEYSGPDRRATLTRDEASLMIQVAVTTALTKHESDMQDFIKAEFQRLEETFKSAFPGGDPHGHRAAHEQQIKTATRWDQLKSEFISKAFTTGMLAAVGFLLIAVWDYFKREVTK